MKRLIVILLGCLHLAAVHAQEFGGQLISEWQWDMNQHTNWLNQVRLDLNLPLWHGRGAIEAATLHLANIRHEALIDDWQGFSNIEAGNMLAAIAVLGYSHHWASARVFVGVRNVNEDFFTSPVTALFANSSCGIVPTIAASYPIANYPFSGLTFYFDVTRGRFTFRNSLCNGVGRNGWRHDDNPFLLRPKDDGVFNMSQLEYAHRGAHYFAGAAIHTRQFALDDDGVLMPASVASHHTTGAWWVYGEQRLWRRGRQSLTAMAQYSENTCRQNACYRYAELGAAYADSVNTCGLSGQYARYQQGNEWSAELTWRRTLNASVAVQPSLQYIHNPNGSFVALTARLCCTF